MLAVSCGDAVAAILLIMSLFRPAAENFGLPAMPDCWRWRSGCSVFAARLIPRARQRRCRGFVDASPAYNIESSMMTAGLETCRAGYDSSVNAGLPFARSCARQTSIYRSLVPASKAAMLTVLFLPLNTLARGTIHWGQRRAALTGAASSDKTILISCHITAWVWW